MTSIDIDYLLQKDFSYYRKLPTESRSLFKSRINEFIKHTEFQGRQGLVVTDVMKVLVSATAVQLTFGFNSYYNYDHFSKIILYPDKYISKHTGQFHTGEMNSGGAIVFSWKHFYEGIKTDNDSRNVGLHEFAHALDFMDKAELGINDYFANAIDKIKVYGRHYIHHQPEKPFFRSYAATNSTEFFAVGTEYFFEAPIEFRKEMPELYNLYCIAYRQQPQPKVVLPISTFEPSIFLIGNRGVVSAAQFSSFFAIGVFLLAQLAKLQIIPYLLKEKIISNEHSYNVAYWIIIFISVGLFIMFNATKDIGFFNNRLYIYHTFWKAFWKICTFQLNQFYQEVHLRDVLIISITTNTSNESVNYTINTSYLFDNKLLRAETNVTSLINYRRVFSQYYNEYKIAFREDGSVKKYDLK